MAGLILFVSLQMRILLEFGSNSRASESLSTFYGNSDHTMKLDSSKALIYAKNINRNFISDDKSLDSPFLIRLPSGQKFFCT